MMKNYADKLLPSLRSSRPLSRSSRLSFFLKLIFLLLVSNLLWLCSWSSKKSTGGANIIVKKAESAGNDSHVNMTFGEERGRDNAESAGEKLQDQLSTKLRQKGKNITHEQNESKCSDRDGLIVLNALGRLGNNIFEFAYAKLISKKLCWPLVYRPAWQGPLANDSPNNKGRQCFPNADLRELGNFDKKNNISQALLEKLDLNVTKWSRFVKGHDDEYSKYVSSLETKGQAMRICHAKNADPYYDNHDPASVIKQKMNNTVQLLSLEAFFIKSDWMMPEEALIRHWFHFDDSCCFHTPPDDAIVIHVRDFDEVDSMAHIDVAVYQQIMEKYNYRNRPLWIVCQPSTKDSDYVKTLLSWHSSSSAPEARVVTGNDEYDAMCILTRSKTLILTYSSTFSQMGAFLAGPSAVVHYPIMTVQNPHVTISMPNMKYHLVESKKKDKVIQYDVPHDHISFGNF